MYQEFEHKIQEDGSDSWIVSDYESDAKEVLINRCMVFTDPTDTILVEKQKYDKRLIDGMDAYLILIAEFRISGLTRDIIKALENQLESVRNEITNGQWITGLEKLEEISTSTELTQEIYDRLHLSLTTYINNNY